MRSNDRMTVGTNIGKKNCYKKTKLRGQELNPGLPRDRRKY